MDEDRNCNKHFVPCRGQGDWGSSKEGNVRQNPSVTERNNNNFITILVISDERLSYLVSTHSVAMAHPSEGRACWPSVLCIPLQLSSWGTGRSLQKDARATTLYRYYAWLQGPAAPFPVRGKSSSVWSAQIVTHNMYVCNVHTTRLYYYVIQCHKDWNYRSKLFNHHQPLSLYQLHAEFHKKLCEGLSCLISLSMTLGVGDCK